MSLFCKGFFFKYYSNALNQGSVLLKSKSYHSPKFINSLNHYCNEFKQKFYSKENSFAHGVLENIPAYNLMVVNPSENFILPEIIDDLKNYRPLEVPIEKLCELVVSHAHFDSGNINYINEIFDAVKIRCHEMNDDQLALVLRNLKYSSVFDLEKKYRLSTLWKQLDKACHDRWKSWTLSKVFYFLDLWYALNIFKRSDFVFYSTLKFARNPNRLTSQQVVQLLFYLNVLRRTTKDISMFDLECRLEECIKELTIEEIGIALMGFFKTSKHLHNEKLLSYIIDRTIVEIKTIPELTLASVLKALRFSMKIPLWKRIPELLNFVEQELPRLTIQCSVHASLLTTKGQILHEGILRKVSQKLVDNITNCRLKDMEKVAFPLSQLNFDPEAEPCIYQSILNELCKEERKVEVMSFPKTFIALVHYFCLKGLFSENLIKKVLDMDFIHFAYGKKRYIFGREILYIDVAVELECPAYEGPRLPIDIRNYLSKRYSESLPNARKNMTKHQLWHTEIKETAESLFGKEHIVEKYLLPNHPRADIVLNLDREGKPLPLDNCLKYAEDFTGPIMAPVGGNYYAVVIGSKNMFLYQSTVLNGETVSKLKQLRLLGYMPVLVSCNNWPSKDSCEKIKYLKALLSSATK